jgi:protein-glutamine gamma-glutamyltransferase
MRKYFQISLHTLIITAFLALGMTGRLDSASIVLFAVAAGWSLYRTIKDVPPPLSARGAFVLSCFYIAVFVLDTTAISRSFIPATIHLVLFLEIVKLYQEKTDKDYFYLIVLAFLTILAASSLTIDISFVTTLVLFLVALVSTLMSFDMYRSARKALPNDEQVAAPLGTMSIWATTWILVVAVLLFFLIPRVGTGYFSRAATESLLMSGFTENVQLGEIGLVKKNTSVVMRANLVSGTPFAVLKWRGIALDAFDGRGWYKTNRFHSRQPGSNNIYTVRPADSSSETIRYEVLMEPLATTALFGPYRIQTVQGSFTGIETDSDDGVYVRTPPLRRIQYDVVSDIPARPRTVNGTPGIPEGPVPPELAPYLQLPQDIDPRIQTLALDITGKASTVMDKATAVEAYLKRYYKYTLELTWDPGDEPISTFLFSAKAGHCEYFASSMAILLRTVGIPTRLVNGFLMGEYNPVGGDYIIRESDAHSWVEVYVPGSGWLEFDPTPPDPTLPPNGMLAQVARYVDAAELYWSSYILIYDSGLQFQLFRSAQDKAQSIQTSFRSNSHQWMARGQRLSDGVARLLQALFDRAWFWVLIALAVPIVTGFKYRKSIRTRVRIWLLRHGRGAISRDVVEQMFYRAARMAERRGKGRRAAETWREWIIGLPDPARRSLLERALEVFEKSKYGRMPVSASDFELLEDTIREMKA